MPSNVTALFCKLAFMPRHPKADKTNQPEFGRRLELALGDAKKTRKELADHLGVAPQSIGQVINGPTVAMTAENCAKAAKFLGVSGYWLATGDGEMIEKAGAVATMLKGLSGFEGMLLTLFRDLSDDNDRHAAIVELNQRRDRARAAAGAPASDAGNPYAGAGNRRTLIQGRNPERRTGGLVPSPLTHNPPPPPSSTPVSNKKDAT